MNNYCDLGCCDLDDSGVMNASTGWDTGSMTVVVTHSNGEKETFRNILVPTKGEAIAYKDGRVEFESAETFNPICYTVLDVHSIATFAE